MPNLLFISSNQDFCDDMVEQLNLYAKDFNVFSQDSDGVFFDIIVVDENIAEAEKHIHRSIPIFLMLNADNDYDHEDITIISKPLSLNLFLDKIQSVIHFHENTEDGYLQFNDYELRPLRKEILNLRNNEIVKLTEKEVSILKHLYKAQSRIVTKSELLQEVWGYNPDASTHTIETHIYRLRQKVENDDPNTQLILTSEGGYQLNF